MSAFGRIITAMVTPFTSDGQVDYPRAAELAQYLVANGSDSLVVCGTTGESPTLTASEKLALFETVKKAVGETPVIAGTGNNCTAATVSFSRQAVEHGADAILVVAPYYNKPPQAGLYEHFRTVAAAVQCPVVVYNIPGRTGIEISPDTLVKLAEIPNIVAVKEALPTLEPVSALSVKLAKLGPNCREGYEKWCEPGRSMTIYSGDDSATLPMMSIGAYGVISVASHVAGPQMQEMIQAYLQGKVALAQSLHLHLYPLFVGLFATTNPILPKAAMALRQFPVGQLRLPLVSATNGQVEQLAMIMRDAGVL